MSFLLPLPLIQEDSQTENHSYHVMLNQFSYYQQLFA